MKYVLWMVGVWIGFVSMAVAQPPALLPATQEFRPSQIYFGAYRRNEPLAEHPDQWSFVLQHADGFMMHFGFWLNNDYKADPIGTAKALGPILRRHGLKTIMEIGFPRSKESAETIDHMGDYFGHLFASKISDFEAKSGLHVDEIECELRLSIFRLLADRHPDWSAAQISAHITGAMPDAAGAPLAATADWPRFLSIMHAELGDRPINIGCPPVYVPWKNLFTAGRDMRVVRSADLDGNGKPKPGAPTVDFDGPAFWGDIFRSNVNGFVCDSPWFLTGNANYVKQGYLKKVVDFTRFAHAHGKKFQYICNSSPAKTLAPAAWDAAYAQQSLESLQAYQLAGGRADRYIFESWYTGPFTIVPETQPNKFTHLVRQGILYLKGPGETLSLDRKGDKITLTNTGDVPCLPAIRVQAADPHAVRVRFGADDVTTQALSPEGAVPGRLLDAGAAMECSVSGASEIEAFWNPQDPSNQPRATLRMP
ncbi:MAG: hypothetical protein ACTHM6_09030 [Tepidisphaeraceae bacterium]